MIATEFTNMELLGLAFMCLCGTAIFITIIVRGS